MIDTPSTEPAAAPEIHVDAFQGILAANGVLKINFVSMVANAATGEGEKRVVLRMAVTIGNLIDMTQALGKVLEDLARMNAEATNERPD